MKMAESLSLIKHKMEHSLIELLTYYVIAGALIIGAPAVFFTVAFMPALMNTKGAVVGYKIHRDYGDTSIFTNITGTEQ
jgi:hypothetical protein